MDERKLLIGGVGLVKGNIRDSGKAMISICDELEPHFGETIYTDTPFDTVSLILRFGTDRTAPEIGRVNKRHAELEVAVELPMAKLRILTYEDLRSQFKLATLQALLAVGDKYRCKNDSWVSLLEQM